MEERIGSDSDGRRSRAAPWLVFYSTAVASHDSNFTKGTLSLLGYIGGARTPDLPDQHNVFAASCPHVSAPTPSWSRPSKPGAVQIQRSAPKEITGGEALGRWWPHTLQAEHAGSSGDPHTPCATSARSPVEAELVKLDLTARPLS